MPKRWNHFQDVVAMIYAHLGDGATLTESEWLPERESGELREVDVVLRAPIAGHEMLVKVEATAKGRPATKEWVEQMIGKHLELPPGLLVLVSESGFAETARRRAERANVVCLAPEDDPARPIVDALASVWAKSLQLDVERAAVLVETPDGPQAVDDVPIRMNLYDERGEVVTSALEAFCGLMDTEFPTIARQLGLFDVGQDQDDTFSYVLIGDGALPIEDGRPLFGRHDGDDPPAFYRVLRLELAGRRAIRVGEVPLSHKTLGEATVAYGKGTLDGQYIAVTLSDDPAAGERASLRPRDPADPTKPVTVRLNPSAPTVADDVPA